MTLLLSTIPYRALSPSYLQAIALPVELQIGGAARLVAQAGEGEGHLPSSSSIASLIKR